MVRARLDRGAASAMLLFASACAGASRWSAIDATNVTLESHPGADAVVLSNVAHLRFLSDSKPSDGYELTRHVRIKPLSGAGRRYARVFIPVDYWTEIVSVSARSTTESDADGGGLWMDPSSLVHFAHIEAGMLYTDNRVAIFDIPGAAVGRVLEWEVTTRSRQSFAIEPWVFNAEIPVLSSRLEVELPDGWDLRWGYSERGAVAHIDPHKAPTSESGHHVLAFEQRDLPAVEREPFGLPFELIAHRLQLTVTHANDPDPSGVFPSWNELGSWYRGLTQGLETPSVESLAELDQFLLTEKDKPDAIYRFVRDRIRYAAIAVGIGALQPHPASDVYRERFGDCKDMATLLTGLYRHYGITAYPALVGTRNGAVLHPDIPSAAAFNHVVVAIPLANGAWRFVDPTAKHGRFDEVPWAIQGQSALVVRDDHADLVVVPSSGAARNVEEITWRQDEARSDRWTLEIRASGVLASVWRSRASGSTLESSLKKQYLADLDGAELVSAGLDKEEKNGTAIVRAELRLPHAILASEGRRIVPLGQFLGVTREIRFPVERESPIDLGYARTLVEKIIVATELGERAVRLPSREGPASSVATYRLHCELADGSASITRRTIFGRERVGIGEAGALRAISEMSAEDARDALILSGAEP